MFVCFIRTRSSLVQTENGFRVRSTVFLHGQLVKGINLFVHGHAFVEAVGVSLIQVFVRYDEKSKPTVAVVREFGHVIFISDAHALGERGILPFFLFVFFVAVTVQRVYQSRPPEGFIINLEILVVFVQQRRPQAGIGHQDTVDRMYHTVFHGVVFQLVDDGGPAVDDGQGHLIGIQRIPLAFEDEW